jgi:hypothetical protein
VNDANVMALHSPFATVMWDYINRGNEILDAQSLPKVSMPNRQGFVLPPEEWKHGMPRLQRYP